MTRFSRSWFIFVIFSCRFWSMKGPFLVLLLIPLFLFPASNDQLAAGLLRLPGAVAKGRLAPRRLRVAARAGLALASTVRVVGGVHRRAAHGRALALPARAARFAAGLVLVLQVADLAHRGHAADVHAAHLARRHPDDGVVAFFRDELGRRPGGADELPAA